MCRPDNVKIYKVFFLKKTRLTCCHFSQRTLILLSRYYKARGVAIMNYVKKRSFLLPCTLLQKEYLTILR